MSIGNRNFQKEEWTNNKKKYKNIALLTSTEEATIEAEKITKNSKGEVTPDILEQELKALDCRTLYKITKDEILDARKKLINGKSTPKDIKNEMLRYGGDELVRYLEVLYNLCYKNKKTPKDWRQGLIKSLHKKGPKDDPSNYRPITLLCPIGKLYATIINNRISNHLENNNLLSSSQNGFRTRDSRNCQDHIFTLSEVRKICDEHNKELFYAFIDFKSAFDMVPRDAIISALLKSGVNLMDVRSVESLYRHTTARAAFGNQKSREFNILQGVAQGCPLSPTLFAIFINNLLEKLNMRNEGIQLKY